MDKTEKNEVFQTTIIDEQIERLRLIQHPEQQDATPGARTIAEIQHMYQERAFTLENAWARIASHAAIHSTPGEPVQIDSYREVKQMQKQPLPSETAFNSSEAQMRPRQRSARKRWRRVIEIGLVAALVVATIFGWGIFSQTLRQQSQQPTLSATPRPTPMPTDTPDPNRGFPRCTFALNDVAIHDISMSIRNQIAVVTSHAQAFILDAATCKHLATYHLSLALGDAPAAWAPDGQRLALSGSNVTILDGATGKVLATYWPRLVALARVGSASSLPLASYSGPGIAGPVAVHSSWSPDGHTVASMVDDFNTQAGNLQLWDASTGTLLHILPLSGSALDGKTFWSPDGRYLLAVGALSIRVWDTRNWRFTTYTTTDLIGAHAAWSPNGQFVAIPMESDVQIWNTRTGKVTLTIPTTADEVGWSPDGRYLATASKDVRLWNAQTGKLVYTYHYRVTSPDYPIDATMSLAWSRDSKMFATLDLEGKNGGENSAQDRSSITVWNVA